MASEIIVILLISLGIYLGIAFLGTLVGFGLSYFFFTKEKDLASTGSAIAAVIVQLAAIIIALVYAVTELDKL